MISNIGSPIKIINDTIKQKTSGQGDQLTNIVNYLYDLAQKNNIVTRNLWLENLLPDIYLKDLRKKYNIHNNKNSMDIILGEYDDPYNQRQDVVKINLLNRENFVIYGNAESGKETFISTFIYDSITNYTSEQVQFYILDFGSEALKIYKNAPHVGDVLFLGEDDKIDRFFDIIQNQIRKRKSILSSYNGDYSIYISKENKMPIIIVIVNNYEAFEENYSIKYDDIFLSLTREGSKCGILFLFTASAAGSIKYRLTQNLNKKIVLQLTNEDDFNLILDKVGKLRPSHIFGRGITVIDDKVYEFQTAKICNSIDYNVYIEEAIKKLNEINSLKVPPIPIIPEILQLSDVSNELKDITNVPIGMVKSNLSIYKYNFLENFITVIASKNMNNAIEFVSYILREIEQLNNIKIKTLDAEKIIKSKEKTLKQTFDELIEDIKKEINENNHIFTLYTIIGIEKFISDIDEIEFNNILNSIKESEIYSFILIDNVDRLKEHSMDAWYQEHIGNNNAIWVGDGIENQPLIFLNFRNDINNKCGKSFGYVITGGEATLIKLIGMKEKSDENE